MAPGGSERYARKLLIIIGEKTATMLHIKGLFLPPCQLGENTDMHFAFPRLSPALLLYVWIQLSIILQSHPLPTKKNPYPLSNSEPPQIQRWISIKMSPSPGFGAFKFPVLQLLKCNFTSKSICQGEY